MNTENQKIAMKKYVRLLLGQAGLCGQVDAAAKAIGVSSKSVYKWLDGVSIPSGSALLALQRLAHVPGVMGLDLSRLDLGGDLIDPLP